MIVIKDYKIKCNESISGRASVFVDFSGRKKRFISFLHLFFDVNFLTANINKIAQEKEKLKVGIYSSVGSKRRP